MLTLDTSEVNQSLEGRSARQILQWAWDTFGPDAAASSSFQTQSVPMLHLISEVCPDLPVLFLDTGFHFPETLSFRDRLVRDLDLNLEIVECQMGHSAFMRCYGTLYRNDPDACCYLNKVQPLEQALSSRRAWITGIRRDQTKNREQGAVLSRRDDGLYRIAPLIAATAEDIAEYIRAHDLPEHPLAEFGYRSVGCAPCTVPAQSGDERAGRWAGSAKTECGIHADHWNRPSRKRSGDPS